MGAPISIDGGTVMPMGETNGYRILLLYKAYLVTNAMGLPHWLLYYGNGMSPWGNAMGLQNLNDGGICNKHNGFPPWALKQWQWNVPMGGIHILNFS